MEIIVRIVDGDLDQGWFHLLLGPFKSEEEARKFFEENVRSEPETFPIRLGGGIKRVEGKIYLHLYGDGGFAIKQNEKEWVGDIQKWIKDSYQ